MRIRALIVDDEPHARIKLRKFLEAEDDVEIVGEAAGGKEAVRAIKKQKPDLVFLDVQMPGFDGFRVIESVGHEAMAQVIFVTAYDKYALRAFEIHALDYLLKPFDQERFRKALDHARDRLNPSRIDTNQGERLREIIREIQRETASAKRIFVQNNRKFTPLKTDEIDWIEASGNYAILHTRNGEHLLRESLRALEKTLDPQQYFRANRSAIVNLDFIDEIQPFFHGEFIVVLKTGQRIVVTRTHRANLLRILGRH